jgi:S-adenosylmethionine hydrolase
VDPGVGTERQAVAVSTGRYVFVAPDNGLLTRALEREGEFRAYRLDADHYFRAPVSATFEGRDVFAPAAAWIARGVGLEHMGPAVTDLVRLAAPPAPRAGATIVVRVLHADRFGNLAIDVTACAVESACGRPPIEAGIAVEAAGQRVDHIFRTFADAPHGEPFLLVNSAGYLEIAVREARADETLGLASGCDVEVSLRA